MGEEAGHDYFSTAIWWLARRPNVAEANFKFEQKRKQK
jgi:hypothetical protein